MRLAFAARLNNVRCVSRNQNSAAIADMAIVVGHCRHAVVLARVRAHGTWAEYGQNM